MVKIPILFNAVKVFIKLWELHYYLLYKTDARFGVARNNVCAQLVLDAWAEFYRS